MLNFFQIPVAQGSGIVVSANRRRMQKESRSITTFNGRREGEPTSAGVVGEKREEWRTEGGGEGGYLKVKGNRVSEEREKSVRRD